MASFTPYAYFQCPCTDASVSTRQLGGREDPAPFDEDERTFDGRAPRSNYSLYPLEHLLYCEDCHQIRCPRCVLEETVMHYCPNCLFEVPSSTVKSEGNICTRSCFQCPICIAPLSVSSLEVPPEGLGAEQVAPSGPYILNCSYCAWSSTEIGIKFDRSTGIYSQLAQIQNGGDTLMTPQARRRRIISSSEPKGNEIASRIDPNDKLAPDTQFSVLKTFYQSQLVESSQAGVLGLGGDYSYGSPGALSRIMAIYTGGTNEKKAKNRVDSCRDAKDATEGLQLFSSARDQTTISKLLDGGWQKTLSVAQQRRQPQPTRFLSDIQPIPFVLRSRRSKRCRICRHILTKPESKLQNVRFRIRLVATNYIPSIVIQPLQVSPAQSSSRPGPTPQASNLLIPHKPVQYLLTFRNPLFDTVKVTLGTPAKTPGRFASKVTILCPQFEVGANIDAWDEALRENSSGGRAGDRGSGSEKRRTRAEIDEGQGQAEAGKIWEKGRNWVSVVMEVVPASLRNLDWGVGITGTKEQEAARQEVLKEDEDVLEIPVAIRLDWEESGSHDDDASGAMKDKEGKEKRELSYWCVIGVGKIARD